MRPIYSKLYSPCPRSDLSTMEINVSKWWVATLKSATPEIAQPLAGLPRFVIYTDAATSGRRIAAILFEVQKQRSPSNHRFMCRLWPKIPDSEIRQCQAHLWVGALGIRIIYTSKSKNLSKYINIYVDNDNAIASLIRADRNTEIVAKMACLFRQVSREGKICVWIGRAKSKPNIADPPPRMTSAPYQVGNMTSLTKLLALALRSNRVFP